MKNKRRKKRRQRRKRRAIQHDHGPPEAPDFPDVGEIMHEERLAEADPPPYVRDLIDNAFWEREW